MRRHIASLAGTLLLAVMGCSSDGGDTTDAADGGTPGDGPDAATTDGSSFSFFVTSLEAMRELSGSQDGFGGDLGGLEGADALCQEIAAGVGAGTKTWRAFLSATSGPGGTPVHAIDRIGTGPWYDRYERLVAEDVDGLLEQRPNGDPAIVDDLPDEYGRGLKQFGDNHDVMTGSNAEGRLQATDPAYTCQDWTSAAAGLRNAVMAGHAWPRRTRGEPPGGGGDGWIAAHPLHGCEAGVNLNDDGAGDPSDYSVGAAGGYGAIYCFALTP